MAKVQLAFDERAILATCVAPRPNTDGIFSRRALFARRLARLGATPDSHHGLLADGTFVAYAMTVWLHVVSDSMGLCLPEGIRDTVSFVRHENACGSRSTRIA